MQSNRNVGHRCESRPVPGGLACWVCDTMTFIPTYGRYLMCGRCDEVIREERGQRYALASEAPHRCHK